MKKLLAKIENISKSVIAATTAVGAIMGILAGIYHGIYKLNQTANNIVRTIPIVENNSKFADINVDYDISLAEKQLSELGSVDRILMRKLLLCLMCNVLLRTGLLGFARLGRCLRGNRSFIMMRCLRGLGGQ